MKSMMKHTKGQVFDQLSKMVMSVGSVAIILVVVFLIMAQGQDQIVTVQGITDETNVKPI